MEGRTSRLSADVRGRARRSGVTPAKPCPPPSAKPANPPRPAFGNAEPKQSLS